MFHHNREVFMVDCYRTGSRALGCPRARIFWTALCCAVLSACGGGGDSSSATANPPTITAQPGNQTVLTGAAATFSVAASGPSLTYQWRKNATAIAGATTAAYTTPPATWNDSGAQYTVVVSNADGSVTSGAGQLNLVLSADQQAFENLLVAPAAGSHELYWNLNLSGPETSGVNYAWTDSATLALSPLTHGPQTTTETAPVNLTTTLALPADAPSRILKNGAIVVMPLQGVGSTASYVGSDVQIDFLAADNTTVLWSQTRTTYTTVALSGVMAGSTDDAAHFYNSLFANPAILKPAATWLPGAAYTKYFSTMKGDRYLAIDCITATTGVNVSPCFSGTTLTAALTTGITSASDATTYHLGDGAITSVGGVSVWVATAARPVAAVLCLTSQYRIYFELNGNVYTGSLLRDGAGFTTSYYVSNPAGATITDRLTFLPFQIRLNKAARDSVLAAMNI
jgi:hypothetical protein